MILPAAYIPSAIAIEKLPRRWDKRIVIIFGMICCAISLFLVGPTAMVDFGEDKEMWVMIIG